MVLEKLTVTCKTMRLEHFLTPYKKMVIKKIRDDKKEDVEKRNPLCIVGTAAVANSMEKP